MPTRSSLPILPILPVDGGVLTFDREAGRYALARGPSFAGCQTRAPRSLQIGLLTPCNLRCSFCYRDVDAPSRLTADFLIPLLQEAARWGVLEVSFGGGEPLLFPGLAAMLHTLHETTALGLNLTTNGVLLRGARLAELAEVVGQLRVSAYPDNDYRGTLRRTRSLHTGLNLLVTPANVERVEALVVDALRCGADDVLLLGYKGPEPALHLGDDGRARLRRALRRLDGLPLRLDICLYPHFADLPHLFARHDCGAGDDFLVITPDRAVQACSFSERRVPFATFAELRAIYEGLRAAKPIAKVAGCTRASFSQRDPGPPAGDTLWVWSARAANNSGDFFMLGEFADAPKAREAAAELRQLYAELHATYRAWNAEHGVTGDQFWGAVEAYRQTPEGMPPQVAAFAERHAIELKEYRHGIVETTWEPTIVTLGRRLMIFHGFTLDLDEALLKGYYRRVSGSDEEPEVHTLTGSFHVRARARGHHPEVIEALERLFAPGPRPFGQPTWMYAEYRDQGIPYRDSWSFDMEWAEAANWELELGAEGIRFEFVMLGNMPVCVVLLEHWLRERGYEDIDIEVSHEPSWR